MNMLMFVVGSNYFIVNKEVLERAVLMNNPAWGGKECYEIKEVEYKSLGGNDGIC